MSFYNRTYNIIRPVAGHRAAFWVATYLPAILFAGIPLVLFWAMLTFFPSERGVQPAQDCGAGQLKYDC